MVAWGSDFQGLVRLGTSISAPLLFGDLLGVDLLGAVRQGCMHKQTCFKHFVDVCMSIHLPEL